MLQVRKEQDLYLQQLESEGLLEDIYGAGVQIIKPTPGYAIRTRTEGDGKTARMRVYINICSTDKVEKVQQHKSKSSSQPGWQVNIPIVLSAPRGQKEAYQIWDVAVHSHATARAVKEAAFREFLTVTAMEKVEETAHLKLRRRYRLLQEPYHGLEGQEGPPVMTLRTGAGGKVSNGRLVPLQGSDWANSQRPADIKTLDNNRQDVPPQQTSGPQATADKGGQPVNSRSHFKFPSSRSSSEQKQKDVLDPGYCHCSGEVTPQWSLTHQGDLDLGDTWGDTGRGLGMRRSHPKALVVRVELPGVSSAGCADLQVDPRQLTLVVEGKYRLTLDLPFTVDEVKGRAKFDKKSHRLEVTLPVVTPPAPPVATIMEIGQQVEGLVRHPEQDTTVGDPVLGPENSDTATQVLPSLANGAPEVAICQFLSTPQVQTLLEVTGDSHEEVTRGEDCGPRASIEVEPSEGGREGAEYHGGPTGLVAVCGICEASPPSSTCATGVDGDGDGGDETLVGLAHVESQPQATGKGELHSSGVGSCGYQGAEGETPNSLIALADPLSEIQKKWRELHDKQRPRSEVLQAPSFSSSSDGGQGAVSAAITLEALAPDHKAVGSTSNASESAVAPRMRLQPRINKKLALSLC